jgi:ElaB/YqjD/DUF883 family membrane-anchored ribosome-binding protein
MGEEPGSMTPRIRSDAELPSPADDPQQIRADMANTRAEMAETIDAIQARLSPQHLMQEARDTVRDATVGKVKDMMTSATDKAADLAEDVQDGALEAVDYVRQNPIPAALIGAGIAWLLMRTSTGRTSPAYSRQRQYGSRGGRPGFGQDRDARTGEGPSYRTAGSGTTGPGVTERIQDGWQHYSRQAETHFQRWIRENPLAVGAAALAVGAAVGLSAPGTDTENTWLGETRDGLVERVQDVAKDTVAQATKAVDNVSQAVDDMAQGNQGQQAPA